MFLQYKKKASIQKWSMFGRSILVIDLKLPIYSFFMFLKTFKKSWSLRNGKFEVRIGFCDPRMRVCGKDAATLSLNKN